MQLSSAIKIGALNWPKDTPPLGHRQDESISARPIEQSSGQADGKRRKDIKVEEGHVVQEKHEVKGDIVGATIGTGGGTFIGAVFSHFVHGFGFGLAGSAAYIAARKGKDLDLPAQTGMLVRMDNAITLPVTGASNASLTSNSR